ncbi:hypothetical protein P8A22_01285 [Streptomyces laculatispora]|uniref:Uncharacterized protein n=1 Tax=Streptomyces laculatispora TaxID=887464 RepID=A0ABY9HW49_9ACTN|nr:hypothetical protein [Streptomyces laculatispora]WLQ38792.1 hypothetical protein P8A22_01285 [Streptomyces laculatispora]
MEFGPFILRAVEVIVIRAQAWTVRIAASTIDVGSAVALSLSPANPKAVRMESMWVEGVTGRVAA